VEALGVKALPVQLDVRDDASIQAMVKAVIDKFGRYDPTNCQLIILRIDILVNNAGALWWKKVIETPMKRYVRYYFSISYICLKDLINGINSRGSFACTQAVLPYMLKQGHGKIIVMSPPIDLKMLPGKVGYCISKFGMTMLAHGLAEEVQGTGVSINALW
jgi:citronellol/citronellal dehydrogenase